MIPGAPEEARWVRAEARSAPSAAALERLVRTAFPRSHVTAIEPLASGFRNANFKVQLDSNDEWIVLRVYEHDPSLCQKEVDLIRLVAGSVPVADVIHAEPAGLDESPPFALIRHVEGITFHELNRRGDRGAIAQAACSAGETLATIGRFTFAKSGWLAPGPTVAAPLLEGADPTPRFVDRCLESANLKLRMAAELRDRTHALVWSSAAMLGELDRQACLVHGDFGKRNLLVREKNGRWPVVAVLDWEFAISGSPLADLGHFLRYENSVHSVAEPHFSKGYLDAGGAVPPEWRRRARLVDMTALCESLTHDQLPDKVVAGCWNWFGPPSRVAIRCSRDFA